MNTAASTAANTTLAQAASTTASPSASPVASATARTWQTEFPAYAPPKYLNWRNTQRKSVKHSTLTHFRVNDHVSSRKCLRPPEESRLSPRGVASGQMPRSQPAVLSSVPAAAVAPATAGSRSADATRRCQLQVLLSAHRREESASVERARKPLGWEEQPR